MRQLARTLIAAALLAASAPAAAQTVPPPAPAWPPPAVTPPAAPPPAAAPPAAPAPEPSSAATPPPPAPLAPEPPAAAPPATAPPGPAAPTPAALAPSVPAQAPAPEPLSLRLAVQTEAAIGFYPGDFYNHLVGARLDVVVSPHVSFGGYLGYTNLKGKDGRAHDLLPYAQVEYLAGPPGGVRIPLRFASGYLPRNGPIVRMSAGFAFPVGKNVDLITELLAPMIWVTRDQMVISMNLAAELAFRF
jgi:hypothetical protein